MEERQLVIGGFYKHFKNKLYQVRGIAFHSETKEKMVVYQAMYGDYSMYVRPYDMFLSEVEHEKYPEAAQRYRFEQVNPSDMKQVEVVSSEFICQQINKDREDADVKPVIEQAQDAVKADYEPYDDCETEDGVVDGRLLRFLDAETYNEKLNVLTYLKSGLDDKIIDAIAASMDTEVPAGTIEERYRSLRSVIMAHSKYECTRLRDI